jgi:hypothetical protein
MQAPTLLAATFLLAGSLLAAQQTAPSDSLLPLGTRVRFWFGPPPAKWHEGYVRDVTQICFIVFSDELKGGTTLQYIDSLQVDRSGWRRVPASRKDSGPPPQWVSVSPSAVRLPGGNCKAP